MFKYSKLTASLHTRFQLIVYLGCTFSILIVLMIGALSLHYLNKEEEMNRWIDRNYRVIERIGYIRSRLNEMSVSRYSWITTSAGAPRPDSNRYNLSRELATLDSVINGDPRQKMRMTLLRNQINEVLATWQNNDTIKVSSRDEFYKRIFGEDQKFGRVRTTLMAINDAEQQLLLQQQVENKAVNLQIKRATIAATIIILAIITGLLALIITELRYRKKTLEKEREIGKLKSSFVSLASHEFRTPLSSILLSVNLIKKYADKGDTENISKHSSRIENAVKNLITILEDFLSLEKLDAGKVKPAIKPFDLDTVCNDVLNDMLLIARPGQRLTYERPGPNNMVVLDEHLIKNAIINLISNAIKYSGENTSIFLRTEINDDKVIITVGDNGAGIPEKEQKNLFKPFFRVNENGNIPGTGLGLNIVMRYVQLMDGTLTVTSIPNKETLFTMSFNNAGCAEN